MKTSLLVLGLACGTVRVHAGWLELPAAVICGTQQEIDVALSHVVERPRAQGGPWLPLPDSANGVLNGKTQHYWVKMGAIQFLPEGKTPCVLVTAPDTVVESAVRQNLLK